MSMPFEEGVANIHSMFPQFDIETIKTVLINCNGSAENTINALLSMDALTINTQIEIPKEYKTQSIPQINQPQKHVPSPRANQLQSPMMSNSPSFEGHSRPSGPSINPQKLPTPVKPIFVGQNGGFAKDIKASSPIPMNSPLAQSQTALADDFLRPPSWFNQLSQPQQQQQKPLMKKRKKRPSQVEKDHMMAMSLQQQLIMEQESEIRKQQNQQPINNDNNDNSNSIFKSMGNAFSTLKSKFKNNEKQDKQSNVSPDEKSNSGGKKAYENISMADDPELNQSLIENEVSNVDASQMFQRIPDRPAQDL